MKHTIKQYIFTKRGNEKVMKQKMFHVKHFGLNRKEGKQHGKNYSGGKSEGRCR